MSADSTPQSVSPQPIPPQPITPELRNWLNAQAQAALQGQLKTLTDSGWSAETAEQALHLSYRHLLDGPNALPPCTVPVLPEPAPAFTAGPRPDLNGAPTGIDVGDRVVQVLAHLKRPLVVLFGNLLSDEECEALIAEAQPQMRRSETLVASSGGSAVHPHRTSSGMFFDRGETALLTRVEQRIARLLQWPIEHGEGMQVLCYLPGAEYKPHFDYFDPGNPRYAPLLERGGQRLGTLLLYLNTPEAGGATVFPDLGFDVLPQRGNALFFAYPQASPDSLTRHGGAPVVAGEKWVATKWLRERPFAPASADQAQDAPPAA